MGRLNKLGKKQLGGVGGSGEGGGKGVERENKKDRWRRGGGTFQYVRGKQYILKGDKSGRCSKKTPLYIICLVMFTILEGLMLDAVCKNQCLGVVNIVLNLQSLLLYMDRKIYYLQLPIIFGHRYLKEKRYVLPNTTGEVMWSCNVTAIQHDEREKCESSVF